MARKPITGTRKSTLNKRRKGILAVALPWLRRFGMIAGALVLFVWVGAWLWLSGTVQRGGEWTENQIILASADWGFTVENILVEGRINADPDVILGIVNAQKGDPLFAFQPQIAQDLLQKVNWIEAAHVERRLPDTIYIKLQERVPLALWRDGKTLKLLDKKGRGIAVNNLRKFKDLMLITGKGAPEAFPALAADLQAEPLLRGRIRMARHISERRWDLTLKNAMLIKLPEEDVGMAVHRLAKAQEESALLDRDIIAIDLRETDRMSVRTKPGQVQEYQSRIKANAKAGSSI